MAHAATTHVRINRSLLAHVERQVLLWLAHRLPERMHSDHLTALAVVGTAIASLSFALARLFPVALVGVVAGLVLNWFGGTPRWYRNSAATNWCSPWRTLPSSHGATARSSA